MIVQLPVWGLGRRGDRGLARSIARTWILISSQLAHMVYLLPLLSYLAGSKSVSASPSDQDTMPVTALDALLRRAAKMNFFLKKIDIC